MLKHLVFLLYLLSYTTGIGAITLGYFLYKYKLPSQSLKYFLYADLFLGLTLFLNTLNYYEKVTNFANVLPLSSILMYGLLVASFGMVVCLSLAVNHQLDKEFSRQTLFYLLGIVGIAAAVILHILVSNLLEIKVANHLVGLISSVVSAIGVWYNVHRVLRNLDKIPLLLQSLLRTVSITGLVIVAIAVIADLIGCFFELAYPIALSPVAYFSLNLCAIIFARKHYSEFFPSGATTGISETATIASNYDKFCEQYNITPRELEIILLIAAGHSNQEISDRLYISFNTARNHIYNIYKKLGVKKRRELIGILHKEN